MSGDEKRIKYGERSAIGQRVQCAGDQGSEPEEWRQASFTLLRQTAPCWYDHDQRRAVGAADEPKLNRQFVGRGSREVDGSFENSSRFIEREEQHARADAAEIVHTVSHRRHHAKISAATTERPEQLRFAVGRGGDDAPIRENNFRGEQIIERKPETADQRSVSAAQR